MAYNLYKVGLILRFICIIMQGNLWSWLFNPDCQDQYSVIHNAGSVVSVFTNTNTEPKLVMKREVSYLVYDVCT